MVDLAKDLTTIPCLQPQYQEPSEDGEYDEEEPEAPPPPPEPPLTVALLVGGPGTAAARLDSFRAAAGLAQASFLRRALAILPRLYPM